MSPKDEAEREYMSRVSYANVIGNLMYAMVCTRPDISQVVGVISRYMHNPGNEHWQVVKWILRYFHNTVDVDFAGDQNKQRSTTSYVFTFAKTPVSWKSSLQSTIALSTIEAEYMAITEAVNEEQRLIKYSKFGKKNIRIQLPCECGPQRDGTQSATTVPDHH
ncbi:secreted RxLR effector protein 161-like [Nicotiana sylvestris]|uniref:secreted RxLR effector protein 161-like n=1 Tax=Nicotiana sylvestris TaxID=4096 RepID=UPI00388C9B82